MNWAEPAATYSGACLQNNFEVSLAMDLDAVEEPMAPLRVGLTTNQQKIGIIVRACSGASVTGCLPIPAAHGPGSPSRN